MAGSLPLTGTTPPGKSTGREIAERAAGAAPGSVPVVGNALAVTLVTALGWLEQRREKRFTELAGGAGELRHRVNDPAPGTWRATISSPVPR